MRSVYVNGKWSPESDASISVFDRGFLFADAVYEVVAVVGRKLIDYPGHVKRLARSLAELDMAVPMSEDELLQLHRDAVDKNSIDEGLIYLQVTRGAADRDFMIDASMKPSVVIFTQKKTFLDSDKVRTGLKMKTVEDLRWGRRDIKTVQLLYSSLMKTRAAREGLDDVILVEDGIVTEASASNLHIVTDGRIVTPPLSNALLPGITRASVIAVARENGLDVEERQVRAEELASASEVFITAATAFVTPVVEIDGRKVGEGVPGPITRRTRELYIEASLKSAI